MWPSQKAMTNNRNTLSRSLGGAGCPGHYHYLRCPSTRGRLTTCVLNLVHEGPPDQPRGPHYIQGKLKDDAGMAQMQTRSLCKQKLLEHRRARKFWVQQNTAAGQGQHRHSTELWDSGEYDLRKYCSPALLFSRNRGRNLEMTLLGGRDGTAASKLGNVSTSLWRNSSNSE